MLDLLIILVPTLHFVLRIVEIVVTLLDIVPILLMTSSQVILAIVSDLVILVNHLPERQFVDLRMMLDNRSDIIDLLDGSRFGDHIDYSNNLTAKTLDTEQIGNITTMIYYSLERPERTGFFLELIGKITGVQLQVYTDSIAIRIVYLLSRDLKQSVPPVNMLLQFIERIATTRDGNPVTAIFTDSLLKPLEALYGRFRNGDSVGLDNAVRALVVTAKVREDA
jgi:hypothetical protein